MADELKTLEGTTNPAEEARHSSQLLETTMAESVQNISNKLQEQEDATSLNEKNSDQLKNAEITTIPEKSEEKLQMEESIATAKQTSEHKMETLKEKTLAPSKSDSELPIPEDIESNPPDASQERRVEEKPSKNKFKKPTHLAKRTRKGKADVRSVGRRKSSCISRKSYRMDVERKTNSSSETLNDDDSIEGRRVLKTEKRKTHFTLQDILSKHNDEETLLPDFDEDLSSSSSISAITESNKKCSVRFKEDFLKNFEDLPSITKIALEPADEKEFWTKSPAQELPTEPEDIGKFVNPLTGSQLSPTSSSKSEVLVLEQESVDEDEILVEEVDVFIAPFEPVISPPDSKVDDDSFDMFSVFEKKDNPNEDESKAETKEEKEQHQLLAATLEFLYGLFDGVVLKAEKEEGRTHDTSQFSKLALVEKLMELICEHNAHKSTNFDLHRKVVEHFKRNKVLRTIMPLSSDVEFKEYNRYMQELRQFDHIIKKTLESKTHYTTLIDTARSELNEKQTAVAKYEENSKNLILETFGSQHLRDVKKCVESDIAMIYNKRNEISTVRLKLIKRQNILGSLMKKSDKLEKISDTLHMSTFISTQTEVQALDKKIEERNMELLRLQLSCNSDLHVLAHLKEKIQIVLVGTQIKKSLLDELLIDQTLKREKLFQLKLIRTKLRKEFDELSFHSGLLSKPELMHDYDATFEQLEDQRKRIQKLQTRLADLLQNIEAMKHPAKQY